MFEIAILCIIALAVGYWVTLWLMGRHDDVLHGDFVRAEPEAEAIAEPAFPAPPFPQSTSFSAKSMVAGPRIKSSEVEPASIEPPAASPPPATPTSADRSERLQALLVSIKRDLKDPSQL